MARSLRSYSRPLALAQTSRPATYITADQVKQVNALPGVDRQIVNVDVGNTNLAVGVVHRGAPARRRPAVLLHPQVVVVAPHGAAGASA